MSAWYEPPRCRCGISFFCKGFGHAHYVRADILGSALRILSFSRHALQMRRDAGIDTTGEDDLDHYEGEFEYDSDDSYVTTGWDSQADDFSSDEGMPAIE